jgi:hypothetical protein
MYRIRACAVLAVLAVAAGCGAAEDDAQAGKSAAQQQGPFGEALRREEQRTTAVLVPAVERAARAHRMMREKAGISESLANEYVCLLLDAYNAERTEGRPVEDFVAWGLVSLQIRPYKQARWRPVLRELGAAVEEAEREEAVPALYHAGCLL